MYPKFKYSLYLYENNFLFYVKKIVMEIITNKSKTNIQKAINL